MIPTVTDLKIESNEVSKVYVFLFRRTQMNKCRVLTTVVGLVALAILGLPMIRLEAQTGNQGHGSKMDVSVH